MIKAIFYLLIFYGANEVWAAKSQFAIEVDAELGQWQSGSPQQLTPKFFSTISQKFNWTNYFSCAFELNAKSYSTMYKSQGGTISEVNPRDFDCLIKMGHFQVLTGFTKIDWTQNLGPELTNLFTGYDYRRSPFTEDKDKYSSPMVKLDYFGEQITLTALAGVPSQNKYSLSAEGINSGTLIIKNTPTTLDYGGRISGNNSWMDWQFSGFSLADRDPQYTILTGPSNLQESHATYSLLALGASVKLAGGMLRIDFDYPMGRSFSTSQLTTVKSDQTIYVAGYDTPIFLSTIFSIQYAESKLMGQNLGALTNYNTGLVTIRALYSGTHKDTFEILGFDNTLDGSAGLRIDYSWNDRSIVDFHIGGEFFNGQRGKYLEPYLDQSEIYLKVISKIVP